MSIKYVMESYELLDNPSASGEAVRNALIDVGRFRFRRKKW